MQTTFEQLYKRLSKAAVQNRLAQELQSIGQTDFDAHQLDCLFHPEQHPPVWRIGPCDCGRDSACACQDVCLFDALKQDENGNMVVDKDLCVGCHACVEHCKGRKLVDSKDILPTMKDIHDGTRPVYALVAPAFINQYSEAVTPGKLRTALKKLGFAGMVEVALFADILTLKEALEFERTIHNDRDFMLTSCCCPVWIAMIRKIYHTLVPHVPGAVSPMVACGRAVKQLVPQAATVFIGPCIAKKSEAREPDIADAIDHVLTFVEIQDMFAYAQIDPAACEDDARDHSSRAGRIYARTGGVSEAVESTVRRLHPARGVLVQSVQANGVPACRELLKRVQDGTVKANFIEGMGCVGGCVGGPKALIDRQSAREHVNRYGEQAAYPTPIENPYVIELLNRLGFETIDSLVEHSDIFTRTF